MLGRIDDRILSSHGYRVFNEDGSLRHAGNFDTVRECLHSDNGPRRLFHRPNAAMQEHEAKRGAPELVLIRTEQPAFLTDGTEVPVRWSCGG